MKVKLDFGPDVEVTVVEKDEKGNPLSISITPKFAKPSAHAVLAYGAATSDGGEKLDMFSLIVSGAVGKVLKRNRTKPAKALVDMTDAERKAAKKTDKE